MQLLFTAESSKLPMANSLAVLVFLQDESFAFFCTSYHMSIELQINKKTRKHKQDEMNLP